jgi:hypothetical protein
MAPVRLNSTVVPVVSVGLDHGIVQDLSHHSGNEYPTLVAVAGAGPRITLSVPFRAAFDMIGFGVLNLTTCDIFFATFASLVRQSGANHIKLGLGASCTAAAQITGASVTQDGILLADVEIVPLSNDGVSAPLVRSTGQTLPTLASQPILHTAGPLSVNGTVYPGSTSVQIDLSPTLDVHRGDGALYPMVAARTQGQPSMTLAHADPVAMTALLGSVGVAASSNIVVFFRPYDATTGVVGTGATAVSLTVASGRVSPERVSFAQGQVATIGARVVGLSTSSTHPFAVSVAATAPALP